MLRILALVALVASCSSHASPPPSPAAPPPSPTAPSPSDASTSHDASVSDAGVVRDASVTATPTHLGKHGDVCRIGERHRSAGGGPKPVECGPGLHCCYPCGIQGCDDVCMTEAECNVKRP